MITATATILKPHCLPSTVPGSLPDSRVPPVASCLWIGGYEMDKVPSVSSVQEWASYDSIQHSHYHRSWPPSSPTQWRDVIETPGLRHSPRLHESSLRPSHEHFCLLWASFLLPDPIVEHLLHSWNYFDFVAWKDAKKYLAPINFHIGMGQTISKSNNEFQRVVCNSDLRW